MEITIDDAFNRAVEAQNAGKIKEADRLYTSILAAQPEHPDANHNMGLIGVTLGDTEEALPYFKKALDVNSDIEQHWISYIIALIDLGFFKRARAALKKASRKRVNEATLRELRLRLTHDSNTDKNYVSPDPQEIQIQPVLNLFEKGRLDEALVIAKQLLQDFSSSSLVFNIIGGIHYRQARLSDAVSYYKQAVRIKPDYVEAYVNLANTLKDKGDLDDSVENYKQAIKYQPDNADAYSNMGRVLALKGDWGGELDCYIKAIEIQPDHTAAHNNLVCTLPNKRFTKHNPELSSLLVKVLGKNIIRPKRIAGACISLLMFELGIKTSLARCISNEIKHFLPETVVALSDIPLLLQLMTVCPLPDLEVESLLTKIRYESLLSITSLSYTSESLNFYLALALQCFTNEYIYPQTDLESERLQEIDRIVGDALAKGQQPEVLVLLCLASYKPLSQYPWYQLLVFPQSLKVLAQRQIWDVTEELTLKASIPTLQDIKNDISLKVQTQYEHHPYPRWVNLSCPVESRTIPKIVSDLSLKVSDLNASHYNTLDVLIAGCGTGQQSIEAALEYTNCKVLAIDLSLSSLAYAKRKTNEFGISNIEYMHADILHLAQLDRKFDVVRCSGVLHHMDNPMAGWGVITDCLKVGGLIRIGLYSELARQHIVKMRDEISSFGLTYDDNGMKKFRNFVVRSDKSHHRKILNSPDFYSTSTFIDLLFHTQEHRFTLPEISNCLDNLGLVFCGFEDQDLIQKFRLQCKSNDSPYDLAKWHNFEVSQPDIFAGMYEFWCQKLGN